MVIQVALAVTASAAGLFVALLGSLWMRGLGGKYASALALPLGPVVGLLGVAEFLAGLEVTFIAIGEVQARILPPWVVAALGLIMVASAGAWAWGEPWLVRHGELGGGTGGRFQPGGRLIRWAPVLAMAAGGVGLLYPAS